VAKDTIRDFSATASANTDIQSVNVDENCAASGINNAIRELMADLKNVSTGAVALETPQADSINISGTGSGDIAIIKTTANSGTGLYINSQTANQIDLVGYDGSAANAVNIRAGGATGSGLNVNTSNNVGIGTASPNVELEISGASEMLRLQSTDTNKAFIAGYGSSTSARWLLGSNASNDSVTLQASNSTGELLFKTGGANERMRIASDGKFYVGTTSNANNGAMIVQQASNGTGITVNGVNNTSGAVFMYFTEAGGNCGYIQRVGQTGAVTYATSSDYRLKENVQPMSGALAKVSLLNPVTYDWIAGGSSQGFIAHELQEVIPEAATGVKDQVNEDGSIHAQGVDTSYVVATLTAAIQEQQTAIEALTARVTALEAN